MFVTKGQFFIAVICLVYGFAVAIVYSLLDGIFERLLGKIYALKFLVLLAYFLFITAVFLLIYHAYGFPDYRAYIPICFSVGFILMNKILRQKLAKITKKVYNIKIKRKR